MGLWKMGVGIDVPNTTFRFGRRIYGLLSSNLISGNSLDYDGDSGAADGRSDGLLSYLNIGDKVLIGPSTYADYEGLTQTVTITAISSSTIGFADDTLSVFFSDNDPITAMGSRCPDGWYPDTGSNVDIYRLFDSEAISNLDLRGYKDRYRLQFKVTDTPTLGVYSNDISSDYFIASTVHRIGMYYQYIPSVTDDGLLICNVASSTTDPWGASNITINSSSQAAWASFNNTVTSPSSLGTWWKVFIGIDDLTQDLTAGANIDDFFLEHAKDTDDEASGVYTFDDYPVYGSRKYEYIGVSKVMRLANFTSILKKNMSSGDRLKKLVISASFKDASSDLRDNLNILSEYQDRGFPLVLHHDIPQISDNIYGYLTIKDTSLTHWSSGYCSFNLRFEER